MKKAYSILLTSIFLLLTVSAVNAASFEFVPSNGNFYQGCINTVVIDIDASGENVNAADIEIAYEPNEVEIIDSDPNQTGIQITQGNAFQFYVGNNVNSSEKNIKLSGGTFGSFLSTRKNFASISFRSKPGVTNTNFDISFTGIGDTLDSNIADAATSNDLLSSVISGSYTFAPSPFGSCENDIQAPQVIFVNPTSGQTGVSANSTLTIQITDNISGVDLNSLSFFLNGEEYIVSDSEVTYTGTPNDYTFVITPRTNNKIIEEEGNSLIVTGQDNAGNTFNRQIVFNVPGAPTQAPLPTSPLLPTATPISCPVCDPTASCDDISVTICHSPNSTNEQTISVAISALDSHLQHGDYIGECSDEPICNIQTTDDILLPGDNPVDDLNNLFQCFENTLTTDKLFESFPILKNISDNVSSNFSTAAFVTGAAGLNLLSFLSLLNSPSLFLNLIGFLIGKKHKKPWGIILDASTSKPIQYAICKLYEGGTAKLIDQTISDSEGRYGFPLIAGSYRLEVSKSEYEKFSTKINIQDGEMAHMQDIELIPSNLRERLIGKNRLLKSIFKQIGNIYRKIFPIIFLLGFAVSVISLYTTLSILNIIIFVLYLITSTIFFYTKFDVRAKYSTIIDSKTTLRLPNALIKIFDSKTGELIDTKLTNDNGYFDFWGNPGQYNVLVSVKGYKFPSEIQTDLTKVVAQNMQMLKLNLKKGHNKYRVLVDPI